VRVHRVGQCGRAAMAPQFADDFRHVGVAGATAAEVPRDAELAGCRA
jgi:hypothetical protein